MMRIGILGAGTWGVTLAKLLAEKGEAVTVWSALPEETAYLRENRVHPKLPGVKLPEAICFTDSMAEGTAAEVIVFAVPSVYIRATARQAAAYINNEEK